MRKWPSEMLVERGLALREMVDKAIAAHNALPPVDRTIADVRQRQSWVRGELRLGLDDGEGLSEGAIAAIPKDPAVILADEVERLRLIIKNAGLEP